MPIDENPIILWDIDGTLLTAGLGGLDQYHRALRDVVPTAPGLELSTHGKTDWQVIRELLTAAGLPLSHAEDISDRLDQLSSVFLGDQRLHLLPEAGETLKYFARLGVRNGLLTGNSQVRSQHKLGGAGLDLSLIDWGNSFFGSRAGRRAEVGLAARHKHPRRKLLIVGDTPFDGHAAAEAGIPFLAVCTGTYARRDFSGVATVSILNALDAMQIDRVLTALAS